MNTRPSSLRRCARFHVRNITAFLAATLCMTAWLASPASSSAASTAITRGPYLQRATPDSLVLRWRTAAATDSRVRFGTSPDTLDLAADDATSTTEHVVTVTGLTPDMQYYYSVGSTTETIAGDSSYTFFTSPPAGTRQPIRVWVLGDSGTADSNAAAVRNAYTTFAAGRYTDLWLMLGDNAYETGTDAEYQAAVFNMYPAFLRQSPLWPTIGNHDTAHSSNPPASLPYFAMFTLPTNAEAGGIASGTEKYYAFDYGNIHFICLDSMSSNRAVGGPMLVWLQNDLASTTADWIIAFWHHPPYSKGSHNSDSETELVQMRQNVLPILEAGGVDLVLSGHSHSYERSFLLNGHYGTSNTLTPAMKLNGGSGREDGTGAYTKPLGGPAANQGAVYAVAGSSGQTSGGTLNHPAMFISLNQLGSMVLDVDGDRLDARFLRPDTTPAIGDYFTLLKNVVNQPPVLQITSPSSSATFAANANITVAASASDPDGSVAQVDFYAGNTPIGSDTSEPYSITWNQVSAGSYTLTAVATDNLGATTVSAGVPITVTSTWGPSVKAIADAFVHDGGDVNRNFGRDKNLKVQTNQPGKNFDSYLKFDTTGSATVGSARLRLYSKYSKTPGVFVSAHAAATGWSETGITWNNRPALGAALGSVLVERAEIWREIDVTAYVQAEKAAGRHVVSFGLHAPSVIPDDVQIKSRENGAKGPELVITP
jgi:hypothetical protein